jgi:hypothetical protein
MSSFVRMGPMGYWDSEKHQCVPSELSPSPLRYVHNDVQKLGGMFSGDSSMDKMSYPAWQHLHEQTKVSQDKVAQAVAGQQHATGQKRHATRKDKGPDTDYGTYPDKGYASTYADMFLKRPTFGGDIYSHEAYTAALLPKSNNFRLPMGTLLRLTRNGKVIVVKVNDIGNGKIIRKVDYSTRGKVIENVEDTTRVLDLSRAAYAYLVGKELKNVTQRNAGIIYLDKIEILPDKSTPLGPQK